jgi:hypothetical protein
MTSSIVPFDINCPSFRALALTYPGRTLHPRAGSCILPTSTLYSKDSRKDLSSGKLRRGKSRRRDDILIAGSSIPKFRKV